MTKRLLSTDRMLTLYLDGEQLRPHGKRVGQDFPLTATERRFYVANNGSPATMVKYLRDTRNLTLAEAWELLKTARYPAYNVAPNGIRTLKRHH
jgi:hypothetical protein